MKPVVVKAAPLTAKPPPAVSSPPTLKIPVSEALPTVRVPIYAEAVLIVVVDKPPCRFVIPLAVNAATLVVPPVIVAPPPPVINAPTARPELIDSLATVRFAIYALEVLIVVVDKPPCRVAALLKVTKPPTCKPPVVIETALEWVVVNPVVVKAAPLTAKPPPAVSSPPTLKIPVSDALPIVRVPIYAEAVLIVVVDKPPCKLVIPLAVNAATLVVPPVIVAPPPPVINPPTARPLVIDSLATVRFAIYALEVLNVVVDKPPCRVAKPLTVAPLLKVTKPPTCKPPVVIETAFE